MIEINNKANCCGCTACVGVCPKNCITMKEDNEGFLYPSVDTIACEYCQTCEKVCPVLNAEAGTSFAQDGYIVQNKDPKVLRASTAGGAFTAIAKYILSCGGVVFGVELSEEFIAHHIYVEEEDKLSRFRNSKYVQSDVGEGTYKQIKSFLELGRHVCFSGTPCQIEGLRNFLRKDYPNLIMVDVVCRAVPSPLIFRKYLELQEKQLSGTIKNVIFRDKYYGYKYSTMNVITDRNQGEYHRGVESDPWLRAFFSNICDRPSCHECHFRKRYRVSDFTIWDCFHVGRFSKELDNDRGATRMLIHSEKGRKIFEEIKNEFYFVKVEPEKIIKDSIEIRGSVAPHEKRDAFFLDAANMSGDELFGKYFTETFRVKAERIVRMTCYRLGIYGVMKKFFVKIMHKY